MIAKLNVVIWELTKNNVKLNNVIGKKHLMINHFALNGLMKIKIQNILDNVLNNIINNYLSMEIN